MKYVYKFITMILIFILIFTICKLVVMSFSNDKDTTVKTNNEEVYAGEKDADDVIESGEEIAPASELAEEESIIEEQPVEEVVEPVKEEIKTEPKSKPVEESNTAKYSENEIYELAKIIMCEAEGESQTCKEYVGQVIINRVNSSRFPNTIHGVIFQGIQFSPTFDGRWEKVEPNQACYDAAYKVINSSEPLIDALYFEACRGDSWHSRNLTMVVEVDNTRFYK